MDVLKPDLLWINGKCYRIPFLNNAGSNSSSEINTQPLSEDYGDFDGGCDGSSDDEDVEIGTTATGRLQTFIRVPQMFFGCIIGAKGETRKLIEAETGALITIPKNKHTNCEVMITGEKRSSVVRARRRLMIKVSSARQRQRPTHFISIPMTSRQIQNAFLKFKDDVCQNCDCSNERVDSSIFQSPMKLHLTLGTMVLGDDFEVKEVTQMFQRFKEDSQNPLLKSGEQLKIRMRGVEYMNDDPAQVDVLYGRVQLENGSDDLQRLADDLFNLFSQKGFIVERRDNVKLHVTLMNTLYRDELSEAGTEPQRNKQRETFDARFVLGKYRDFDFGVQRVDSIHLSKRFSSNSEGYYQMVGSMQI